MGLSFPQDRPQLATNKSIFNDLQAHLQSNKIPLSNYKFDNGNSFPTGQAKMGENLSHDGTRKNYQWIRSCPSSNYESHEWINLIPYSIFNSLIMVLK